MAEKILDFTAEQINHRLSLIDENKNLLQYPYIGSFPANLIDVGDGSILTSGTSAGVTRLTLGAFTLAAGEYQVSTAVTTITETAVNSHGFSLSVTGTGISMNGNTITVSTSSASALAMLTVPSTFSPNWLIKPQIVKKGQDTSTWTPNMDKIGTYVDRRFNSVNTKLRDVLTLMDLVEIVDA